MSVPSNLIPTRITQLPTAPVADDNSLMMIVYQGNNYKIRVGDLLTVAGVPITRQVIAGTGLTGGGALSSNVTLSVAVAGIGATQLDATGVTPGVYGNATNIPVFTVDTNGRLATATTTPAAVPSVTGTANQITISAGPTIAIANNPILPGSGGMILPVGTTGQRGSSSDGNLRYNTTTASFEGYANGAWGSIVSGAGVSSISFGSTGLTPSTTTTGAVTVAGTLAVASGGTGVTTSTGTTNVVLSNSPTLVTPDLGTPSFLLGTNITGTAAGLTAGTVTTNANLTGDVTSVGNATTLATVASAGSTGSSTAIPVITINAKGLTTSITTAAVIAPAGTLSGSTLASGVTASSLTSLGTIASLVVTAGTISTTPSAATDIANKTYVDTVAQGLDTKASVVAGTTANITLSGAQTIDGISIVATDRVLVKDQTASAENGIYVASATAWARASDMSTWAQVPGAYVFIETGTTLADTGWVCTSNAGGTINVTAMTWAQFSGAGSGVSSITFGSTGLTPATTTTGAVTVAGTLAVANGGTGQASTLTQYGVVYGSTTTAMASTAAGTTTTVLHGNASGAPSFGAVSLTADISGTLPIANGGTNSTATATAGGSAYGTGTAFAFTAAGTAGQVLTSAGASAPVWSGISGGTF